MKYERMSLADVYRSRLDIEQTGKILCYYNASGQRYILHLVASQELQYGKHYPVLIEHHNGQLLRKHLLGSDNVYIGCEEP
jgi:hypothetical protein